MAFTSADPVLFIGKSHVTATPGANHPEVGTTMRDGDESYIWVQNIGSSTASVSYGCVVSGVSGYSVTVSSVSGVDFLVGFVKHADIPTDSYGWLCTKGFTQIEMSASDSCTAGQGLMVGLNGTLALKSFTSTVSNIVFASPSPIVAKSMEAIASGGSGTAYISVF